MDLILEFAKLLIPAALVLYAMYLVVKSFLHKDLEKKMLELRTRNTETVFPIRLQAYERMCLFLERISPNNLIPRIDKSDLTARDLQHILLNEIREEYNHNVSQQVYMSSEAWDLIKNAKEDLIVTINNAAEECGEKDTAMDLSRKIFERTMGKEDEPIDKALDFVKNEISTYF